MQNTESYMGKMNSPKRDNKQTAIEMAVLYQKVLSDMNVGSEQIKDHGFVPVKYYRLRHIRWMAEQAEKFAREGFIHKAQLWLGFVQGVLWSHEIRSVDLLRQDNTP